MNKVVVVVVLAAIASILLYLTILALVPRYDYGFGGGICFHKPQEIVDHVIEPKLISRSGG
jgi:hypothetical protein